MTLTKTRLTFKDFLNYDFPEEGRYELVNGEIMRIQATRKHDNLADFIADTFKLEVNRLNLNYRVSGRITIRTLTASGKEQGRVPDVSIVDKNLWDANLSAYTAFLEPLQLAVEILSTNWEDDYIDKLDEYQRLGIREYWIVDYLAIGSRNDLGNPKEPTIFVYILNEQDIYQPNAYRGTDKIISPTFPELNLTVDQVFTA
ncbi:Uma2 family endonuclease [Cronbergia sp. UHCC 0137]|uniref:Uma2 family endonuclease n=1 Tax=Cronbergia sp. UHCC 0137 TaxID=3110239 RepID=UPI002B21C343|nr:Uma2 family endonuclease [Cronbergia sp. UHCC 0137]MEA5619862.1 Uma2 family endonuclease [Cronbergia sp. UHCC 0137]